MSDPQQQPARFVVELVSSQDVKRLEERDEELREEIKRLEKRFEGLNRSFYELLETIAQQRRK